MIGELWRRRSRCNRVNRKSAPACTTNHTQPVARHEADGVADRLLGVSGRDAEPASIVFADAPPAAFGSVCVQLVHRLRDQDPKVTPALAWLDDRLSKQEMTADAAVRESNAVTGCERDHAQHRDEPESDRRGRLDGIVQTNLSCRQRLDQGDAFLDMEFATRTLYAPRSNDWREGLAKASSTSRALPLLKRTSSLIPCSLGAIATQRSGYYLLAGDAGI